MLQLAVYFFQDPKQRTFLTLTRVFEDGSRLWTLLGLGSVGVFNGESTGKPRCDSRVPCKYSPKPGFPTPTTDYEVGDLYKGFSIFSATFQQLLGLGTSDKQAKFKWRSCLHSQYLPKISWWLRPKRRLQLVADHLISRHLISRPEKEKAAFLVHSGMVPAMGQIV